MKIIERLEVATIAALVLVALFAIPAAHAEKKYGPGITDTEILLGQTMPYSGPLSAFAAFGHAEQAYFEMINAGGGINGRKIRLISLDDSYLPPKTVEQTRKLVEQDGVAAIFGTLGTPTNSAIHKYLNAKGVPHLFVGSGATKWGDPKQFPWTIGWQPNLQSEARIYARYILTNFPNARLGILYQNDDYGRDNIKGLRDGLGERAAKMIAREVSYEPTDPTVDSQIITLKGSGADILLTFAGPKVAAQVIRKVVEIGWKPTHILSSVSTSVTVVLRSAGLEKSRGIISAQFLKDPTDPVWRDDPGMKEYLAWLKKWYPGADPGDLYNLWGYSVAQTMVQVLKQCGDELSRANLMRQAANLKNLNLPTLLPGIRINTGPADFYPIKQMQMMRFDGKEWVRFGEILDH